MGEPLEINRYPGSSEGSTASEGSEAELSEEETNVVGLVRLGGRAVVPMGREEG